MPPCHCPPSLQVVRAVRRKWQGQRGSNPRPAVLETAALPTELYPFSPAASRTKRPYRQGMASLRRAGALGKCEKCISYNKSVRIHLRRARRPDPRVKPEDDDGREAGQPERPYRMPHSRGARKPPPPPSSSGLTRGSTPHGTPFPTKKPRGLPRGSLQVGRPEITRRCLQRCRRRRCGRLRG